MCRLAAYLGQKKRILGDLLDKPAHSLIQQSRAAKEGRSGLNADGFGMSWYNFEISDKPGVFKTTQPAWNDSNLLHIARNIQSHCFLGHIRASTVGDVTKNNCHPFSYNKYSLVHNGTIRHFNEIKRKLLNELDDNLFSEIKGNTDSECLFFLIMQYLQSGEADTLEIAMKKAFKWVVEAQSQYDNQRFARLNVVITDGNEMIATRMVSDDEHKPLSLQYFSETEPGHEKPYAITIASEPLNEDLTGWVEVPMNHYLTVNIKDFDVQIKKFEEWII